MNAVTGLVHRRVQRNGPLEDAVDVIELDAVVLGTGDNQELVVNGGRQGVEALVGGERELGVPTLGGVLEADAVEQVAVPLTDEEEILQHRHAVGVLETIHPERLITHHRILALATSRVVGVGGALVRRVWGIW